MEEDPIPSSEPLDLNTIQRQVRELEEIIESCRQDDASELSPSDSDDLIRNCGLLLQSRVEQIVSECSDVGLLEDQEFEAYLGRFEQELNSVEAESTRVSNEIEGLIRTHGEDFNRLGTDLARLKCSLDFVEEKDLEKAKLGADVDYHKCGKDLLDPMNVNADKFEIFPNDVCINDILDAAKSLRKSSLQWFVTKVQDRIVLCTMRRLVGKSANKSRYSLEYLDKDETVVAHVVGGVDAFIKVAQGWPLLSSPLKLIYLKSSDQHSKGISLSFLCKVQTGLFLIQEMAYCSRCRIISKGSEWGASSKHHWQI